MDILKRDDVKVGDIDQEDNSVVAPVVDIIKRGDNISIGDITESDNHVVAPVVDILKRQNCEDAKSESEGNEEDKPGSEDNEGGDNITIGDINSEDNSVVAPEVSILKRGSCNSSDDDKDPKPDSEPDANESGDNITIGDINKEDNSEVSPVVSILKRDGCDKTEDDKDSKPNSESGDNISIGDINDTDNSVVAPEVSILKREDKTYPSIHRTESTYVGGIIRIQKRDNNDTSQTNSRQDETSNNVEIGDITKSDNSVVAPIVDILKRAIFGKRDNIQIGNITESDNSVVAPVVDILKREESSGAPGMNVPKPMLGLAALSIAGALALF